MSKQPFEHGQQGVQDISQIESTLYVQFLKLSLVILSGLVLILFALTFYLFNKNINLITEINSLQNDATKVAISDDVTEIKQLDYFKKSILPTYPRIKSEIEAGTIKKLYPLTLKKDENSTAWLVEVEINSQLVHYLISSVVQKKLISTMSSSLGDDANCTLEQVETVGNETNLRRTLAEEQGYLILSSTNCLSYGGGTSTSVYSLETGEKITISGDNFSIPGTTWKGISETGNALGKLSSINGINKPILIIEYGNGSSYVNKIEDVKLIAYFDLQTGKLIKTELFE